MKLTWTLISLERAHDWRRRVSHLVEIVVAQTVGEIQVRWVAGNRISPGRRIKAYIHGVSGSRGDAAAAHGAVSFCRLQSKRAKRERREKRGVEADPQLRWGAD